MPSVQIRRATLLLFSVAGMLLLYSGSALAAGPPTLECCLNHKGLSVNRDEFSDTINPNGASTTVQWEYRKTTAGEFKPEYTTEAKNIGSGTSGVLTTALSAGLKPATAYEYRAKASNSFGTVYSTVNSFVSPKWAFASSEGSSEFSARGSATINFPNLGGGHFEIPCSEARGSKKEGLQESLGEINKVRLYLANCRTFINGKESAVCKPSEPVEVWLDSEYKFEGGFDLEFSNEECALNPGLVFGPGESALISMPFETYLTTQPLTITKSLSFAGHPGTLTLSQEWTLSGAHLGEKFAAIGG